MPVMHDAHTVQYVGREYFKYCGQWCGSDDGTRYRWDLGAAMYIVGGACVMVHEAHVVH